MFKYISHIAVAVSLLLLASCEQVSTEADKNYDGTYDITYALGSVIEKDPVNISGIDVYPYFDFFGSLNFVINVVDGKMVSFTYDNGEIPFSAHKFAMPSGRTECEFDDTVSPNVLKIKGTDDVVATFVNGELIVPFVLDCEEISYEFHFKEVAE